MPFEINWVDVAIFGLLGFFIFEAIRVGFWAMLADFVTFSISLVVGLSSYQFVSEQVRNYYPLPRSVTHAVSFLVIAILVEVILGLIFSRIIRRLPLSIKDKKILKYLSPLPALGETIVVASFILTLIMGFPITPKVKTMISQSRIGGFLIQRTQGLESALNGVFGGVVEDSLTYLTIKPGSRESVPLVLDELLLNVDEESERAMFDLVNEERKKQGISQLKWRDAILPVAREHAEDMWRRKYFGHISPEGEDVGDRMDKKGLTYLVVGENLALSPDVHIAMNGLMNSEGHRANILEEDFENVAIGVIDNGYYGKMFVQIFTD